MTNIHEKHFARFTSLKLRRLNLRRSAPASAPIPAQQGAAGARIQPIHSSAAKTARMISQNLASTH